MGDNAGQTMDHDHCSVCGCSKEQYFMLRQRVEESKQRITLMESEFLQSTLYTENELDECREEVRLAQQRYNALEKSHQELHEINSDLEERILDIAAAYEKEKQALNREVLTLSQRLLDTKFEINKQEERNVRFKKDCQLAVELLQCTPSGAYMQHKVSQLPHDLQYYVHRLMGDMNSFNSNTSSSHCSLTPSNTLTRAFDNSQPLLGSSSSSSTSSSTNSSTNSSSMNSSSTNSSSSSSSNNQPPNGFLSGRVYDSVPANIIARAMQLRDEEEKKEVEKLIPTLRSRGKTDSTIVVQDKGTQTAVVANVDQLGEQLCVKCGADLDTVAMADKELLKPEPMEPSEPKPFNLLDLSEPAPVKPAPVRTNEHLLLDLLDSGASEEMSSKLNLKRSLENVSLADLLLDIPSSEIHQTPLGMPPVGSSEVTADIMSLVSPIDSTSPMQDDMSDSSSASKESIAACTTSSVGSSLTEADAAIVTPKPKPTAPRATGPARRVQSGSTQHRHKNDNHSIIIGNNQSEVNIDASDFKRVGKAAIIKSQMRSQRSPLTNGRAPSDEDDRTKDPATADSNAATTDSIAVVGKGSAFRNYQATLPDNPSMDEKTERVSMYVNETNAENLKKKPKSRLLSGAATTTTTSSTTGPVSSSIQQTRSSNPKSTETPNLNSTSIHTPTAKGLAAHFLQTSV